MNFDPDNLHHAYLIEGGIRHASEVLVFTQTLPDAEIIKIQTDAFKLEDAHNLKSLSGEKSISLGKKIFVISANSVLREAQNAMLKLFEEPISGTHFFLIVPDANALLKTLLSRFYLISERKDVSPDEDVSKFLAMPLARRIDFIKEKLAQFEEENEEEETTDSARASALRFLNSLEFALHQKVPAEKRDAESFEHIWKARELLRVPGSSVKNLLESVALTAPVIQ